MVEQIWGGGYLGKYLYGWKHDRTVLYILLRHKHLRTIADDKKNMHMHHARSPTDTYSMNTVTCWQPDNMTAATDIATLKERLSVLQSASRCVIKLAQYVYPTSRSVKGEQETIGGPEKHWPDLWLINLTLILKLVHRVLSNKMYEKVRCSSVKNTHVFSSI